MARRLLCCPHVNDTGDTVWKYLYVDTSKLLVKNVTDELRVFEKSPEKNCCFDILLEYIQGNKTISEPQKEALSFNLLELNSLEWFKTVNELKFKTGSEKILFSCLLSYYRREYDGSQQYAFFSHPTVSNLFVSSHDGVEHEMTLETREFVPKEEEQIELETLDKGKTDAEREAEAELAQAQAEFEEALAKADNEAAKKEKRKARRKARERELEEEHYRELRNQDDVTSEEYKNLRQYEEEMRQNNDILTAQYADENYSSLPGFVPADVFSDEFEKTSNESMHIPMDDKNLYNLASKLDEFGVPYTVVGVTLNDGTHISEVYYTSEYAVAGSQAVEFYELEKQLTMEGVINPTSYFNAFQLSALDYACVNYVDASFINSGEFNSRQMYRIIEAGLNGQDMSVLSNPAYSPAQMDALSYFMHNNWDTSAISSPSIGLDAVADEILKEEVSHSTLKDESFFENHDYSSFLSYNIDNGLTNYSNDYDSSYRKELAVKEQVRQSAAHDEFREFKENLHDSYVSVQKEQNYISDGAGQPYSTPSDVRDATERVAVSSPVDDGSRASKSSDLSRSERAKGSDVRFNNTGNESSPVNQHNVGTNKQGPSGQRGDVPKMASGSAGQPRVSGLNTPVSHRTTNGIAQPTGSNQQPKKTGVNTPVPHGASPVNTGARTSGGSPVGKSGVPGSAGNANLSGLHRQGKHPTGSPGQYNFNSGYTTTGRTRSDGSYVPRDNVGRKGSVGPQRAASAGGGSRPNSGPKGDKTPGVRNYPLNDLKVRSNFAKTAGLKVVNGGSQAVGMSGRFLKSSVRQALFKMARNDETSAYSAYGSVTRVTGNAIYTARLISDVPRVFGRVGQGISYSSNVVANAGRWAVGKDAVKKTYAPLTQKAMVNEIKRVQTSQFNSIKKQFGENAAKMNTREIKSNINKLTKDKALAKGKKLIEENRKLTKEIAALEKKKAKGKFDVKDNTTLAVKLSLKNKNEKKIKTIAKNNPELKKLSSLMKLEKVKNAYAKELSLLGAKNKSFGKKGFLWKQLPGRIGQSVLSQLYKAGEDATLGGIASATSFAMSFARNPIARFAWRGTVSFVVKPAAHGTKFVAKKTFDKFVVPTERYQNHLKEKKDKVDSKLRRKKDRKDKRKLRADKTKTTLKKRVTKTIGSDRTQKVKKVVTKGKEKLSAVNKARKKVSQVLSAPFKILNKIKAVFGAAKAAFIKFAAYAAAIILALIIIFNIVSVCVQAMTSFIMVGEETADGRIDLTKYVELINGYQGDLQDDISKIAKKKKPNGDPYDNIFYDYNGLSDNNTNQILSMAYVRFDYEWDKNYSDVKKYMKQLYNDSNYVDYAASAPYFCTNGCEEREYKCYDKPDKYATETRKTRYNASDHSKQDGVIKDKAKGCKKTTTAQFYHCTDELKYFKAYTKKHLDLYNAYSSRGGCKSKTEWKTKTTYCEGCSFITDVYGNSVLSCPGHEERYSVTVYYCPGHEENIYSYSCPGHKETICRGEHQDLTITITTLGFDEIFAADSSVAINGSHIKGDAYKNTFTVTGYCSCHKCCHPYDPACTGKPAKTASGTAPKANRTIAVDPKVIPLGTHVWIDGKEYVAEDTGGAIKGNRIDIYFDSHTAAERWGTRNKTVYKNKVVETEDAQKDKFGFTGWNKDNIEVCKNVYSELIADDADDVYKGLDKVTNLSYGSGGTIDFDFSGIKFDDKSGLTKNQQKILAVIEANTIATRKGYCQAWVSNVYQAALGKDESRCCAAHAGEAWGVSNDWSKIQVGATVYGYNNGLYGHVGIYIGEGKVAHNIGYLKIDTLEYWVQRYDGRCWGWNGGNNLTSKAEYNCAPAGRFMTGRD